MFQRLFALLLLTFAVVSKAAYTADEITSLPGWLGALPSQQYSGYLNVGNTYLHYWLVTSESSPSTDPVVVWFNGGTIIATFVHKYMIKIIFPCLIV